MWHKKKKKPVLMLEEPKKTEPDEPRRRRVPNFLPHEVCNAPMVYKYMAGHVVAREHYEAGIKLHTLAEEVSKKTTDKAYNLIKRSECHLALCDIAKAREDATKAMELCPEMLYLHFQHGNVLYNENLFENSLMTYEYGSKQRTYPDLFGNGVNIATGTLENCVGGNAGPMLSQEVLGKIIVDEKLQEMGIKKVKPKEISEIQKKRNEVLMDEKKRHYSEKYLGTLAREKLHMIDMLTSSALFGSNNTHNKAMENMLVATVEKLDILQECLWRRKPLYVFEHKRGKPAPKHVKEMKAEAVLKTNLLIQEITRQMNAVMDYFEDKQWGACYRLCEYLRVKLWKMPDIKGINKDECLEQMIDILGDMYFAMKVMLDNWPQEWNDKRILCILGVNRSYLTNVKEVAKHSFHYPVYNAHQRIKDYTEAASMTESQHQKMFFNFEISCFYSMIHNIPQMRSFARQAVFTARKEGNIVWYINCLFLLARTDLEEGNMLDGMVTLTAAREACFRYGYEPQKKFVERALYLLLNEEPKEKSAAVRGSVTREKSIIDQMPNPDLRSRARTLIWQVNQKPPWKRMPLVKGVQVAFQGSTKGFFEDELVREEQRRYEQKKTRKAKKAAEAALAAAESLAAAKGEGYNLLAGPIPGITAENMRHIVDNYRRRSTFNLEMFHQT